MASDYAHLAHLEPWYRQWLEPAHHQAYRGQLDAALETVRQAGAQLEAAPELSDDEKQLLRYEVAWTPFNFVSFLGDASRLDASYQAAVEGMAQRPVGPLSAPTQAFYQISLAAKSVALGISQPDVELAKKWLERIPPERFPLVTWQHLALLGFHAGDRELVGEAFGELATETSGFRSGYGWLRVNLMYLLLEGRAGLTDFRHLLDSIQHIGELQTFRRDFMPHAERLGCAGELEELMTPIEARLSVDLVPPDPEPTTRRVLGR